MIITRTRAKTATISRVAKGRGRAKGSSRFRFQKGRNGTIIIVKKVIWMTAIWILCIALLIGLLTVILLACAWTFLAIGMSAEDYFKHHGHHHLAHHS